MTRRGFFVAFSREIRARRKELGLSQLSVAARLGMKKQSICEIENSASKVSFFDFVRITEFLGINLDKFIQMARTATT